MNNDKIIEARREKFEEWAVDLEFYLDCHFFNEGNNYSDADTFMAFEIWNAALDSVVVELPDCIRLGSDKETRAYRDGLVSSRNAIHATGVKTK